MLSIYVDGEPPAVQLVNAQTGGTIMTPKNLKYCIHFIFFPK